MPYKLKGNCVVKADTGETVKCHKTHAQALAHLRALEVNVPDAKTWKDEVMKSFNLNVKSMMDMGGAEYARSEAWDCMNACHAMSMICEMCMNEIDEPDDMQSLANIMKSLMEFINGEMIEMVAASRRGVTEEKPAMMGNPKVIDNHFYGKIEVKDKPVIESVLDLSYAKSVQSKIAEKDLAVKYVAKDTIRHPVFLWGNPELTDLENEYFTRDTDFWDNTIGKSTRPLTWDHAQDPEFAANPLIGKTVEWEDNDIGRFAISTLEKGHKYRQAIDSLIERKSLGSAAIAFPIVGASSDSAPQYVKRVKTGKSTWLARWPWFATALTPTPCEPRMVQVGNETEFIKSLGILLPVTSHETWTHEMAMLDYYNFKYKK